jgi:hypothetical protein
MRGMGKLLEIGRGVEFPAFTLQFVTGLQFYVSTRSAVCAASEGSGMSLHAHGVETERCWPPYQNLVGKQAKANQHLTAQQKATCNSVVR